MNRSNIIPFTPREPGDRARIEAPDGLAAWRMSVGGDEFVLFEFPEPPSRTGGARVPGLTAAESDVARHLLAGLSNARIAEARGSSPRTVANQVASIFTKLGVSSRSELLSLFARGGPGGARAKPPTR